MITSVVNIGVFIVIIYFVCFFRIEIDIFYVSKKNNLWFIFNVWLLTLGIYTLNRSKFNMSATKTLYGLFLIICYLLWTYILCIITILINFRFRNFTNFDTDRLFSFFVQYWPQWSCGCSLYETEVKDFCKFSREVKCNWWKRKYNWGCF